MIFQIVSRFM